MKNNIKLIIFAVLILTLTVSFTGCGLLSDLFTATLVEDRINAFQTDLNTSPRVPADISGNFAPTPTTEMASQMNLDTFWNSKFNPDDTFSFLITDATDTASVSAEMTETYTDPDTGASTTIKTVNVSFKMYNDTANSTWLIEEYREEGIDDAIIRTLGAK